MSIILPPPFCPPLPLPLSLPRPLFPSSILIDAGGRSGSAFSGSTDPSRNSRKPVICNMEPNKSLTSDFASSPKIEEAGTQPISGICLLHFLIPIGSIRYSWSGPACSFMSLYLFGKSSNSSSGTSTMTSANLPIGYHTTKLFCIKPYNFSWSGAPSTWPTVSKKHRTAVVSTDRSCRGTRFPPNKFQESGSYPCVKEFHGFSFGSINSIVSAFRRYGSKPAAE
mmetsp:Transcript_32891/g.94433  ORF Transcript_32891/g.94433 Transcript_32891/m.94433 type:complete len:224 (-) Transcript_32891:103-774(-)